MGSIAVSAWYLRGTHVGRRKGLCLSCPGAQSAPDGCEVMDPTHRSMRLMLQKYPRRLNWKAPLVTLSFLNTLYFIWLIALAIAK